MKTLCLLLGFIVVLTHAKLDPRFSDEASSFDACEFCKNATELLQDGIEMKHKQVEHICEAIDELCDNLQSDIASRCHNYADTVQGVFAYIYTTAHSSFDTICERTFQCPPDQHQVFTEDGILETTCEVCLRTISKLMKVLGVQRVTEVSSRAIIAFCYGPGRAVGPKRCIRRAMKYLKQTYGRTLELLKPDVFCQKTLACPKLSTQPHAEAPRSEEFDLESNEMIPIT
eukprot:g44.t1